MTREQIKNKMIQHINNTIQEMIEDEECILEALTTTDICECIYNHNFGRDLAKDYIEENINDIAASYLEEIFTEIDTSDLFYPW